MSVASLAAVPHSGVAKKGPKSWMALTPENLAGMITSLPKPFHQTS